MKVIPASVEVLVPRDFDALLRQIEVSARTCYKSEAKQSTAGETERFVRKLIQNGHEAMLEHASVTIRITCDRGVSHEIVRHRIASYAQESTRYCNYSKDKFGNEITVINPEIGMYTDPRGYSSEQIASILAIWTEAMLDAEKHYMAMLEAGVSPQIARSVLPNSLKTEIVVTMNLREWRHFLKLRTDMHAHPQMREVALLIFKIFQDKCPVIVEDIDPYN